MSTHVIQDWTDTLVPMKYGAARDVRYKVYKEQERRLKKQQEGDPEAALAAARKAVTAALRTTDGTIRRTHLNVPSLVENAASMVSW